MSAPTNPYPGYPAYPDYPAHTLPPPSGPLPSARERGSAETSPPGPLPNVGRGSQKRIADAGEGSQNGGGAVRLPSLRRGGGGGEVPRRSKADSLRLVHRLKQGIVVSAIVGFGVFGGLVATRLPALGATASTSSSSSGTTSSSSTSSSSGGFFGQGSSGSGVSSGSGSSSSSTSSSSSSASSSSPVTTTTVS